MEKKDEYYLKSRLFEARKDALCENIPPRLCDCEKCPCFDLCNWLEENYSNKW